MDMEKEDLDEDEPVYSNWDDDNHQDDFDTHEKQLDEEDYRNTPEPIRGLVGLQNLGNTCYMNGALQALSNCQQLTRFVLDCPGFTKDKALCHSYSELIKEIWDPETSKKPGGSPYAVPTSIIRNIKCIYPAFRGCTQQDAQEFLRCFLEQLHDELKQPIGTKTDCGHSKDANKSLAVESCDDGANESLTVESCSDGANNSSTEQSCGDGPNNNPDNNQNRSIISDTFEFKISSSVVCSSCNNISTTKETFKDLSIPIPSRDHPYYQSTVNNQAPTTGLSSSTSSDSLTEQAMKHDEKHQDQGDQSENETCRELKTSSFLDSIPLVGWFRDWFIYFSGWFWGPQVTLQDCLSIFFGTDPLEGDNEYSCDRCTKKNRGVKFLKILELPEVLCIHFKRYESIGSAKITTHVSFPLEGLELAPFMSENSKPQCTTYNLIACICHHGSALLTGHYTTYALNCIDDQWYEFDDQYVSSVESYQVENSEAYILFYQKISCTPRPAPLSTL